jgi:hypothetical protein
MLEQPIPQTYNPKQARLDMNSTFMSAINGGDLKYSRHALDNKRIRGPLPPGNETRSPGSLIIDIEAEEGEALSSAVMDFINVVHPDEAANTSMDSGSPEGDENPEVELRTTDPVETAEETLAQNLPGKHRTRRSQPKRSPIPSLGRRLRHRVHPGTIFPLGPKHEKKANC